MRTLTLKIVVLLAVVLPLQFGIGYLIFPRDDKAMLTIVKGSMKKSDIVYMGDSVLSAFNHKDADQRPLPDLLSEKLGVHIVMLNHGGYHAGMYLDYLRYLVNANKAPSLLIVPINMRSFSPEWDTNPGHQFEKQEFILKHGILAATFQKPISLFTDSFKNNTNEAWLNSPVFDYDRPAGKVKDFQDKSYRNYDDAKMRNKIIYHYRYRLSASHRRIQEITTLVSIAKRNHIGLLLYITPIDYLACDRFYAGTSNIIKYNTKILNNTLSRYNVPLLDLSESIPSSYFDWRVDLYPNEHMNEHGKKYVASALADMIIKHKLIYTLSGN
jgi:hypothetical protein